MTGRQEEEQRPSLSDLFEGMDRPDETGRGERYTAVLIPGRGEHRLGKDPEGRPALLLKTSDAEAVEPDAVFPVTLRNLSLRYDVECRLELDGGEQTTEEFAVLRCLADSVRLHEYFLRVADLLLAAIGDSATKDEVSEQASLLVELFESLSRTPRSSSQGLWGELLIIARSRDIQISLQAWHDDPEDTFDFAAREERLEVKTYSGPVRQHMFTFEQVYPPRRTRAVIVSLQAESTGHGVSINDLLEVIHKRARLSASERLKLERSVMGALGRDHEEAARKPFDYELACESIDFYGADDIPKVAEDLPPGVSGVRFRADLSHAVAMEMRHKTGLFAAVKPEFEIS